jgi:hypothetical protein
LEVLLLKELLQHHLERLLRKQENFAGNSEKLQDRGKI